MSRKFYFCCSLLFLATGLLFTLQNNTVSAQNTIQECNPANPQCPTNTTCTPQQYTNKAYCRNNPTPETSCDSSHPCTAPKVCTSIPFRGSFCVDPPTTEAICDSTHPCTPPKICTTIPFRGSVCMDPPPTYSTCDLARPNCPTGKVCKREQFNTTAYCVDAPPTVPGASTTSSAGIPCGDGNTGVATAIGCIHTEPKEFVRDILKFVVAIAGGVAFLLMIFGAIQMITSGGNPETLKAGQERFRDAIIGLLFVIFAVLLLKIIGVDILGLGTFLGI